MRLGEIDLSLKPIQASYYLCKPDKTVIHPLKDIISPSLSRKLGKVNEFTFSIPTMIERNRELIENPLIDKIKHRYLIKLVYDNQTEYFVFLDQNKQFDENNENISYQSFSLGYLLADKNVRSYKATSKLLTTMTSEILSGSEWKVGYVDSYFDTKFRSHEIPSQTALQAVYELAEKFNAVIVWDTVNFEINFYNPANIGMNKGLKFKEGKYLESFNVSSNSEEMVTRLKVYGKDGLTFRSLSPTGSNYIEDFSWFMYPFSRVNGIIVASSDYMSDSLCIALEDYNQVLSDNRTQFNTLTTSLTAKRDQIQQAEQELTVLQTALIQIMDELDVLNEAGEAGTPSHTDVVNRRTAKETEIQNKVSQINTLGVEEQSILDEISILRNAVAIETTLSPANILELNKFIIEKEYTNDTIVDEQDLLEDGIDAFNKLREPKLSMSMSITNFLSNVESQNDWDKLTLGDIMKLESIRLRVGIEAKLIEINYDFDNDDISLVIANEKELKDDYRKLMDLLYNANATSTVVNMDKYKWDMIEETDSVVSQMLNNTWETLERNITAGYQQNIVINERGIVVKSPDDPLSWLVIQNGMLAITNDNGNTWKQAIHKGGIVAERILGRLIIGQKLIIEDETGIIRISGSLQEIFDTSGNVKVALGNYATGKYGLKINDGAIDLKTSSTANRGMQLDVNGLRTFSSTGVKTFELNSSTGKIDMLGSINIKTTASTNRGVVFDGLGIRAYNSVGTKTFDIDINGNGIFSGSLNAATGTFSGNLSGASGTFSGSLSAATGSFAGDISAAYGTFNGVFAGTVSADKIVGGMLRGIDWVSNSDTTPFNVYIGGTNNLAMQIYYDSINMYKNGYRYFRVDPSGITFNGQPLNSVATFG